MGKIKNEVIDRCILCHTPGKMLYPHLRDDLHGNEGEFGEVICPTCGLVWLSPRPVQEDMGAFYEQYYTHTPAADPGQSTGEPRFLGGVRDAIRAMIICGYYGYSHVHSSHWLCGLGKVLGHSRWMRLRATNELKELIPPYTKDGLLLDIGCGRGDFLCAMRDFGWNVLGAESDPIASAIAQNRGIPVHAGSFEQADIPDKSADHITMNHVIEHFYDPMAAMVNCHRILKPGGTVVLYTPNTSSLGHRHFQGHWRPLEAPRHLYCFSPATLRACLARCGFRNIKVWTSPRLALGVYDASVLFQKGREVGAHDPAPQEGRRWFSLRERALCVLGWPSGEELVATARKPWVASQSV